MKRTVRTVVAIIAMVVAVILTACSASPDSGRTIGGQQYVNPGGQFDEQYQPWEIDEFQLFGLTEQEILSKWPVEFAEDHSYLMFKDRPNYLGYDGQTFNLEFDNQHKVIAVQRCFRGCVRNYEGPWLRSERDALKYVIDGSAPYDNDPRWHAKLTGAKERLGQLSESK